MSLMEMSFSGAVLIVVILAVRAVLKGRLPKRTFVALWMVALLRLLLPFSVPSAWSAYTFSANMAAELHNLIPGLENVFSGKRAGNELSFNDLYFSMQQNTGVIENTGNQLEQNRPSSFFTDTSEEMPSVMEQPSEKISVWKMIWAAGFLICLTIFGWIYCRCCKEFRMSLPIEKGILGNWHETHPLRRKLSIRQSDQIASPISYGVCRPIILLSKSVQCGDRFRLRYVLEHEYVHIQHFDAAVKLLMAAALCVHWFNPFVYLMYIFFNRDLELACDETVVRRFGEEEKSAYAMALIEMEEEKSGLLPLGNSFSKNAIEERIRAIMKMKKISPLVNGLSVVLVCGITLLFATSCGAHGETEKIIQAEEQAVVNLQAQEIPAVAESVIGYSRKEIEDQIAVLDQTIREKEEELNRAARQKQLLEETIVNAVEKAQETTEETEREEAARKAVEADMEETIANAVEKAQEAAEETARAEAARKTVEETVRAESEKTAANSVENMQEVASEALRQTWTALEADPDTNPGSYYSAAYVISISEEFQDYKKFGLSYDKKSDCLMYQNKTVGYFKDEIKPNVYTRLVEDSGELGIIVNRNDSGKIKDFSVSPFDKNGLSGSTVAERSVIIHWDDSGKLESVFSFPYETSNSLEEDSQEERLSIISEASSDETAFAEGDSDDVKSSIPEEYAGFGVKISDKKNNQWMYQGKGVAVIYDKDHWIFTNESIPERNAVYLEVIRDKKGRVTELKEVTKKEIQKLFDEDHADR